MRFKITLYTSELTPVIPVNYTYPLSSAIYRILARADSDYAAFLHQQGYGKGFKLFCFSQINCSFAIKGDRLHLLSNRLSFYISFHLPHAAESFIKGIFQSEHIDIADAISKVSFAVQSIESVPGPLDERMANEIVKMQLEPLSPVVAGLHNENGNYNFLHPNDRRFALNLMHNWRSKIKAFYDTSTASSALLVVEVLQVQHPKSRLITIKAGTKAETKIRGWMNFVLSVTGEKRFVEIMMNSGAGLYNAQGMGCIGIMNTKSQAYEEAH